MSALKLAERIGTHALVAFGELRIEVRILDAKMAYGRERLRIEPVAGKGSTWIEATRAEGVKRG